MTQAIPSGGGVLRNIVAIQADGFTWPTAGLSWRVWLRLRQGQSGRVLARLAAKYDYKQIGQGRLTNDALIAMSAGDYRPSRPHSEFTREGSRARTPLLMGMPSRFRHLVQVVHERAHCAIKTMDLGI